MKDDFGDRMKLYEGIESKRIFTPLLPVMVRLDGRSFSRWTRGLERPYDERMVKLMQAVTVELVRESNAVIGYTQSDEISLILYKERYESEIYFNGKITKIISVLSSCATYWFNHLKESFCFPDEQLRRPALFDCRAWTVPNRVEAVNAIAWREQDAMRNSINSATRSYYSHSQCLNKSKSDCLDMLIRAGVNWNDYPASFKRGSYIKKVNGEVQVIDMPRLSSIENRVDAIFGD